MAWMDSPAALDDLIDANARYAESHVGIESPRPCKRLAIVTCMDARVDVLGLLGLGLGDVHVIRNAGARVTEDVVRSLTVSSHVLGIESVLLMQHTGCGMASASQSELESLTGSDMEFLTIGDHRRCLEEDIEQLQKVPSLEPVTTLTAALFDVESGSLELVLNRERS